MKTYSLTGVKQGTFTDVSNPPAPAPGEVLVEIAKVGVCGSDIHLYSTGRIGSQNINFPFTIGHECSGKIAAVGEGVSRLSVGDRVAIDPAVTCGECDQCQAGRSHTCRHNQFLGCPGQLSGALSNFVVIPEYCCVAMPEEMTWEQALMSEPLAIAVYAATKFTDLTDKAVGILGAGPIGLCCLEVAKHYGARSVFVTEPLPYRQQAAKKAHSTWAGHPAELEDTLAVHEPSGLDVIFECCGKQEAVDQAIEVIRPGGMLLMIGIPEAERIDLSIHLARVKEVCFKNVRRQVDCVEEALRLIADGSVDMDTMITHHFPFEKTGVAFDLVDSYNDNVIKAIIDVNAEL
jgi:L-iditol 2-dehydrogenase